MPASCPPGLYHHADDRAGRLAAPASKANLLGYKQFRPFWIRLRRLVEAATTKAELHRAEDPVDAVLCAYVARYATERPDDITVYGDIQTGYILTPTPPPDLRPEPRQRATKFANGGDEVADADDPTVRSGPDRYLREVRRAADALDAAQTALHEAVAQFRAHGCPGRDRLPVAAIRGRSPVSLRLNAVPGDHPDCSGATPLLSDTPPPAGKVSVKWPIGQTVAISIEIWPFELRIYKI